MEPDYFGTPMPLFRMPPPNDITKESRDGGTLYVRRCDPL